MRKRRIIFAILTGVIANVIFGLTGFATVIVWVQEIAANIVPSAVSTIPYAIIVDAVAVAVLAIPGAIVMALIAGSGRTRDHETRCRKCGYILRGLTEPRSRDTEVAGMAND